MPNSNYLKGRRKEYRIMKGLKAEGFDLVARSAGSHSAVDIFAFNTKERVGLFIQAKPDSMPQSQKDKLLIENSQLNGSFFCKFSVI